MEARVNEAKKKLLEAGRKAQECKDKAKSDFEADEIKDENKAFQQWAVMNAEDGAYIGALQAHSANEAMEWQEKKNRVYFQKTHGDDQFEKVFVIILPED
ncbi:hypothetical protein FCULG_00005970 [Fusarium culmorum]|uniref:Uncharacterized protein n=1 Tax=Fusarium culmorum TaxID=5516 RepID=A0A2T4GT36_FUSCU|nr:hypothetical protein FCULG_00005970 [Fusarium culmorum]